MYILQQSNENNFEREIERLYPVLKSRVHGLLFKAKKPTDTSGDIVHDVLADCLKESRIESTKEIFGRGKLEYYLNRCIYLHVHGKVSKRRYFELTDLMIETFSKEQASSNTTNLIERMTAENLDLAIRSLDEYEAELVRLWMMPDFSYKECARVMQTKESILVQQVHKAINNLRKYVHHTSSAARDF